jgi:putative ABC transport system permease protein
MQVSTAGALQTIYGVDLKSFEKMRPFAYVSGGPFQQPNDLLVDDIYAGTNHTRIGDMIPLLNHSFRVSGIVAHGKGARLFLPLATLQDLNGAQGRVSAFYLKADDPVNADAVVGEIKNYPKMSAYVVHSMREYLSMLSPDNIPMLSTFIRIVIGISVTIGFIVIFQAMYTAVMERTREIGILKSLGASKLYIVNVIMRETALLAVGGIVVGVVFSFAAGGSIHKRIPTLPIEMNWLWVVRATIIAIVGSLAGAVYPAFKAAQKDPIDALAYE